MAPLELNRLTILNLAAIVCYALATMFHIIAFSTNSWSSLTLEGVQWRMGLWYGCRHNVTDDTWLCTADVFEDKVFQTGISSDWHSGSQVIMTFALVLLILLEFAIISYACIKRLEKHRDRIVGCILALSLTAGLLAAAALALCGTKVRANPSGRVEWSFGVEILAILFLVMSVVFICLDRYEASVHGRRMSASEEYDSQNKNSFTNSAVDEVIIDIM